MFGDYISIYDMQQAKEDGATVAIYYESRLAKLELKESERPKIDPEFDEATEGELQRAKGDLGVMSGLIATNSKEIQYLRDLGDRNIYQFTIDRGSGMQKVGDIQVMLRKADSKRNRYTVDVRADDKLVEKRDKSINEPVQFYTSGARTPYEVVVNEIRKDQVIGYLSVPKVKILAKR